MRTENPALPPRATSSLEWFSSSLHHSRGCEVVGALGAFAQVRFQPGECLLNWERSQGCRAGWIRTPAPRLSMAARTMDAFWLHRLSITKTSDTRERLVENGEAGAPQPDRPIDQLMHDQSSFDPISVMIVGRCLPEAEEQVMVSARRGEPAMIVLPPPTFAARRKSTLKAVVADINAAKVKSDSLGDFSIAPDRELCFDFHNPQVRAAGGPQLGGAEFRSFCGLGNIGPKRRAEIVDNVLSAARTFDRAMKSGRLTEPLKAANLLAQRILVDDRSRPDTMHVAGLGLYMDKFIDEVLLTLDIEMLGNDLQPGIERVTGWHYDLSKCETAIDGKIVRHAEMIEWKRKLDAVGAVCWIDAIALGIVQEADLSIADVIDLLADRNEIELLYSRVGSAPIRCRIRWNSGVLSGCVGSAADAWQWSPSLMSIKRLDLPGTLTCAIPGRSLGSVFDHPLIPTDAIITNWRDWSGSILISIRTGAALVFAGDVARHADGTIAWSRYRQ